MISAKCSSSMSGGGCLVLPHRASVLRTLLVFLEHFWVLRTFRGRTIRMPGRSVPAQQYRSTDPRPRPHPQLEPQRPTTSVGG
eukprot:4747451-Pyramimonas_sp.AAC.1